MAPAICDIILRASKKRSTSWLTSETATPEPLAIRSRRDALMIFGSARSCGVIPRMIACTRSRCLSSTAARASFIWPAPGSIPSRLPIGPILRMASICSRKSSSVSSPEPILAAASSAFCASNTCSACSISESTSPMPRIRLAIRSGWKTSKSSSFSPVDANRIGTPVTSRTDSAAPPRASPSSLVSTTPVKPTPAPNDSAVATASWPIIASTTNSVSSGDTASRMAAAWAISTSSMPSRPAVSMTTTSKCLARASASPAAATATGSPGPAPATSGASGAVPGCGANTLTPARSPTILSWLTAPGRCRSHATSSGV